jgi:RecA/RadA recombinase
LYKLVFNLEFLILADLDKKVDKYKLIVIDSLTDLYRLELNREKKEKNYNLNYFLNQILATLTYLNHVYNINILIINEKVNKRTDEKTIEVQSGGKVMDYWVVFDIKIERTESLGKRKFILTKHPEYIRFECNSNLTKLGFQ